MSDHGDAVDAVLAAFTDYREGAGPRPSLDHLGPADRSLAEDLIRMMETARGIDPHASPPSLEALLAGTEFEGVLTTAAPPSPSSPIDAVRDVLGQLDPRAQAVADLSGTFVTWAYLDVAVRFYLVAGDQPPADDASGQVSLIFDRDPDIDVVGLVAEGSEDLLTQMLSRYDIGTTLTTPSGRRHTNCQPPLPLLLAARRLLQDAAPEWGEFTLPGVRTDPLDLLTIATEESARLISAEYARRYQGEKSLAYKALVGREGVLANLVVDVSLLDRPEDEAPRRLEQLMRQLA